jgi:hypothetical protein
MSAAHKRELGMSQFKRDRWTEAEVLALPEGEHEYIEKRVGNFSRSQAGVRVSPKRYLPSRTAVEDTSAPLQIAQVGPVQVRAISQVFLRQLEATSQLPDSRPSAGHRSCTPASCRASRCLSHS